jgi:hypothetical protein
MLHRAFRGSGRWEQWSEFEHTQVELGLSFQVRHQFFTWPVVCPWREELARGGQALFQCLRSESPALLSMSTEEASEPWLGVMKSVPRQLPARPIRIAEGVIAVPTLEPWVSRCLPRLDPTKERFHGFVQAEQDIL